MGCELSIVFSLCRGTTRYGANITGQVYGNKVYGDPIYYESINEYYVLFTVHYTFDTCHICRWRNPATSYDRWSSILWNASPFTRPWSHIIFDGFYQIWKRTNNFKHSDQGRRLRIWCAVTYIHIGSRFVGLACVLKLSPQNIIWVITGLDFQCYWPQQTS